MSPRFRRFVSGVNQGNEEPFVTPRVEIFSLDLLQAVKSYKECPFEVELECAVRP